jgi:hypothetical protein
MKAAWTLPLSSSDAGDFAAVVKKRLAFFMPGFPI